MGRPTDFTPKLADIICELIGGGLSLRAICQDGTMPGQTTVYRWLADPARAEFREQYARAREAQAEHYAEEILEISDETRGDVEIVDGKIKHVPDNVQRSRLRVDTRKWLMAKLLPKKYGDKLELSGSVGRHEDLLDELERRERAQTEGKAAG